MSDISNCVRDRRVGRPLSQMPRDIVAKVRLNLDENAIIASGASAACLPIATYLRLRALGAVRIPRPKTDLQTVTQLTRLGSLLNQAIALAHSGRTAEWPVEQMLDLRKLCIDLAETLSTTTSID